MRYSTSMFIAAFVSLFIFLGMSLLVTTTKISRNKSFEPLSFTKLDDIKMPDVKKIEPPRQKPVQEKVKQPPVAPKLDLSADHEKPEIFVPNGNAVVKEFDFEKLKLVNLTPPGTDLNQEGDLVQMAFIKPMYPSKALKNKIEGWVKVEFTVNQFGAVVNAKVIDSQPKRVFDSATIRALQKSKFKPLIVDGKAVAQTAVQIIEFKLNR